MKIREFNDDIAKAVGESMMKVLPEEWHDDAWVSSLTFNGPAHFHRPGIVYSVCGIHFLDAIADFMGD